MDTVKLAVVGAGPGGYAAAFYAADQGIGTALIDLEATPGGVCLHRGCIPSKALLHAAGILDGAQHAASIGLHFGEPEVDLAKLRGWKEGVVKKLTEGLGALTRQRKIRYIRGRARLLDARSLEVRGEDGSSQTLGFENAVIATGSSGVWPGFLPKLSERVWDSTAALALKRVPKSLLVIGGSYIGLEMGTAYAALGVKVSVAEMLPGLMPGADRDLVAVVARRLQSRFQEILLGVKVVAVSEEADGVRVVFDGASAEGRERVYDAVLVSIGRRPNSADLGLEHTRALADERGFIRTDSQRRTAEPSVFAIGDVAGEPMLAHKASAEGRVAVEAVLGRPRTFEPKAIPAVAFTDPELAWCGLNQTQAEARGVTVETVRFPWAACGRAAALDRTDGVTKLILEPETGKVLGMGIAGHGAGDLISEGALAIEMGAKASDLEWCIHPHPTLSETVMESAAMFYGTCSHLYRPRPTAKPRSPAA
ncbi:MAG: dihydrolipoyl dehydrogenase [Elusimicrobiota bacterium]